MIGLPIRLLTDKDDQIAFKRVKNSIEADPDYIVQNHLLRPVIPRIIDTTEESYHKL